MQKHEYDAICSRLTATGAPFETVSINVLGQNVRGWRQAPANLRAVFESSKARGDAPFIIFAEERLSYGEHYRLVARCARALREVHGIGKGDRVAIAMRNLPEWSVAFWAILAVGAVSVSINAWMTGAEMNYCIADSGSRILIADDERIERLAGLLPELRLDAVVAVRSSGGGGSGVTRWEDFVAVDAAELPDAEIAADDDATILYTSGTTGNPKGALGSHRGSCNNVISTRYFSAVDRLSRGLSVDGIAPEAEKGCFLLTIPLFHGAGCQNGLIYSMFGGGKIVMMPRWDAREAAETVLSERVTDMVATPAHFVQLADLVDQNDQAYDLSSVETALVGGASPPRDLPARLGMLMPQAAIGTGYGQTECTQIATLSAGSDYAEHPLSCGRAIPICDIRIVNDFDQDVAHGATGELLIRSATLVKGYVNRPVETHETFADGWLRTGDLVHIDEDGRIYIDDRKKDMVIRGGENIYCIEVEQALYSHPDVVEAAVYGMPHPVLGEEPVATVYLREGSVAEEAALRAHVAERVAKFKVPVLIAIVAEPLPRNANGKILKRELRAARVARS